MRDYVLTVPAGGSLALEVAGSFVRCLDATADFRLSIDGGAGVFFAKGTALSGVSFAQLRVENPSASDNTVRIVAGVGEYRDDRLNIIDDAVAVEVTNVAAIEAAADQLAAAADAGPVFATIADVTVGTSAGSVLAANAARRRAFLQNIGSTTIRIGDASVSASRGLLLRPDGAADIETAGAIWAISDAAGGKLAVAEVRRV